MRKVERYVQAVFCSSDGSEDQNQGSDRTSVACLWCKPVAVGLAVFELSLEAQSIAIMLTDVEYAIIIKEQILTFDAHEFALNDL